MHEIDALALNFNHTSVYAQTVITSHGPKIRIRVKSDTTTMITDLMVIWYYKCEIHCSNMLRLCFGAMTHVLIVIVSLK